MLACLAFILALGINAMVLFDDVEEECIDKSPYCTASDCKVRPGYALEYCKKTCGNCEPFCYNSFIVSCKDARKYECDSMLKDYCPLLCGTCRAKKRKSSKRKGARLMPKAPISMAKLGILQKFSTSKSSKSNTAVKNTTSVLIIPAVTKSSFPHGPSTPTPIFGPSTEDEGFNPLPFSDTSSLKSSPIVAEDNEKEGRDTDFEYMEQSSDPEAEAKDNDVFAPEHVRIVLKPPWTRQGSSGYPPRFSHSLGRYPPLPPSRWLLPHREGPQPYPLTQSAFFPKNVYGLPGFGHHLEIAEDAPVNLGELIALLGCRDKDPSICSKITDESCLSRPGYYSKLCPVKCRNCNGLQCLDSIKIDCNKVRSLGGCKMPMAREYCPRTCQLCALPARIAESLPPCKDELDTCGNLAESGVCDHPYSKKALRTYCAKSCGHCRESLYYMNDAMYRRMPKKKQRKPPKSPLG